jgi:hypothetical protein
MPDLTPPPERRLPDDARDRIHDLLVNAEPPSSRPRWAVPLAAAAAVALVASVGAALALNDRGSQDDAVTPLSTTSSEPTPTPTSTPTSSPTNGSPEPCGPDTSQEKGSVIKAQSHLCRVTGLPGANTEDAGTCANQVPLRDPEVFAQRGTTAIYDDGAQWIVCDTFATQDGGVPTLLAVHDDNASYEPSAANLAISENHLMGGGDQFFAAGKTFDGVTRIRYTFPGGHVEDATMADGMWLVDYRPTSGPLADPQVNETTLDPIRVTVTRPTSTQTFTLPWGEGTCAQTNHGC